jgi:uncharacterized protein YggU (UPF0235/DUF167 family)
MMSEARERPWTATPDGVLLSVRLTPKGGRDGFDGVAQLADGKLVLKARVRAAPSEGEANDALLRLLGKALDLPTRNMVLVSGAAARIKRIKLVGDGARLAAALEKVAGAR